MVMTHNSAWGATSAERVEVHIFTITRRKNALTVLGLTFIRLARVPAAGHVGERPLLPPGCGYWDQTNRREFVFLTNPYDLEASSVEGKASSKIDPYINPSSSFPPVRSFSRLRVCLSWVRHSFRCGSPSAAGGPCSQTPNHSVK